MEAKLIFALVYAITIVFLVPITTLHYFIAYTYSYINEDSYKGFLTALPIAFIGCMIGALLCFIIARHLMKRKVRQNIDRNANNYSWVSNLLVLDQVFKDNASAF